MTNNIKPFQLLLSLTVAVSLVMSWVIADKLARQNAVYLHQHQLEEWQRVNGEFQETHGYVDFEDYLFLEEIPNTDYSKGGVYFFGSSTAKVSIMPWVLPVEQQKLVHCYGLSAASHLQQFQFIRYLTEQENFLAAGGDKTLAVFELFYANAVDIEKRPNGGFMPNLFRRHGLYSYNYTDGIKPLWKSNRDRYVCAIKVRCSNFLQRCLHHLGLWPADRTATGQVTLSKPPDFPAYRNYWMNYMGNDWRKEMPGEMAQLAAAFDYLRERKVHVAAVISPLASWQSDLPYAREFYRQAAELCQAKSIPLTDLSRLLLDNDFADSVHAAYTGQVKLHSALMEIASAHLCQPGSFK